MDQLPGRYPAEFSIRRGSVRVAHPEVDRARRHASLKKKEEQIIETRDKPQHLATQRLLSCLQYPDATKSSTKDLSLPPSNLKSSWQ